MKNSNMTFEEIVKRIQEIGIAEFAYDDYDTDANSDLSDLHIVHSIGGGEGGGERVEWVYQYKDSDIFIKLTGFYMSYDGTTWDDEIEQVVPQEQTITVYVTK